MSNIVKVITSLFISNISALSYLSMDELSPVQSVAIAILTGIFMLMTLALIFRSYRRR